MTTIVTLGTDSSGRTIRESATFAAVLEQVYAEIGFTPVITQGGHMGDSAAEKSSTTHNGDAADFRIRNLAARQVEDLVRVLRAHAIEAWVRNEEHGGFDDPHVHAIPGAWAFPSPSALRQWHAGRDGRDGLASNGPDYHPYPLANTPPEDDMPYTQQQLTNIVRAALRAELDATGLDDLPRLEQARYQNLRPKVNEILTGVRKLLRKFGL